MELDRAKEILQALADGVDPYTGDRFPADGPYQRADTVRAPGTHRRRERQPPVLNVASGAESERRA